MSSRSDALVEQTDETSLSALTKAADFINELVNNKTLDEELNELSPLQQVIYMHYLLTVVNLDLGGGGVEYFMPYSPHADLVIVEL